MKKGATEPVVPGNIIFRQRGTLWHAGENCVRGRDHTISALEAGFVRYYRDPARHPMRKYIGVVFDQTDKLPRSPGAPRRRRLGLEAVPMTADHNRALSTAAAAASHGSNDMRSLPLDGTQVVPLSTNYSMRPPNSVLGERQFLRIMAKYKAVRPRQKRLVRFRKLQNAKTATGLKALRERQGDKAKKGNKKRRNTLFARRKWI